MMLMIESASAVRLPAATSFCCSSATTTTSTYANTAYLPRYGSSGISRNRFRRLSTGSFLRKSSHLKNGIRVSAEHLGMPSDSSQQNGRLRYHPSEEISKSSSENGGDVILTPQETARTIVELNSKATLMLTGLISDDFHENIIWPDLPYLTDEHGNIYFQVKNDEDILQTLTAENNFVQTIIGFNAMELLGEMELIGPSEIDFGFEEIEEEDSDVEDSEDEDEDDDDEDEDYDGVRFDVVANIKDEDLEDDSEENLGDWAKLETMRSSHPMYFAKKLSQVASDDPIDWMEQPPAGLAIQGLIRPALSEEHADIQKHMLRNQSSKAHINRVGRNLEDKLEDLGTINGHNHESRSSDGLAWADEGEQDEVPISVTSFYRLEMVKIQLISAHGNRVLVEVEEFRRAQPDTIALSAAKIISCLKDGGEKVTQALQSLCLRCKGIQVEEAAVINLDSLGFDLRVCSGAQIQTLRFAFNSRAPSEHSAERQLNDLLFPGIHHKAPKEEHSHQNEH